MPLLRRAPEGASASRERSPARGSGAASPALRTASSKGGGGKPGGGSSVAARKAHTPLPAPALQSSVPAADDYAVPIREVVRPPNQLQLSAAELEEEVGRSLTAGNPSAPASLVRYSYKDRAFRPEPIIDQQLQLLALGGSLMHRDSDEAARERQRRESSAHSARSRRATAASRRGTAAHSGEAHAGGPVRPSQAGSTPRAEASAGPAAVDSEGGARLHNQFNCADRGAQTGHRRPRDRGMLTEPPPTTTASGSCSRWEIFEAYIADQERQRQTEELARQKELAARREARAAHQPAALELQLGRGAWAPGALSPPGDEEQDGSARLAPLSGQAAKLMERMVQQNLHCDLVMDFKYWDDPADNIKPDEGTLMPLWSFVNARAKGRAVTAIAWSPRYFDMFVVGYGSFDFLKPTTGLVSVYSLKNPGHPEFSFTTPAGVMCLDFHPEHPALLAVGCYDGHIAIFDVRMGGDEPLYRSTPRSGKHSDPVWQVAWQRTAGHELQLASISTDGRVTLWSVSRNELMHQDLMDMINLRGSDEGPSGSAGEPADSLRPAIGVSSASSSSHGVAPRASGEGGAGIAGCSFDFNREQETLFVVGAEDGSLYKCSTAYASEYLQAYRPGHQLPVYAVRWNSLHSRTFLSAGADWKVKLWDSMRPTPVLSFDLGAPVGDVAWAPQSSTVFAAATDSGHVHVFDVAQSRAAAVCVQKVAHKMRLTKIAFNSRHAVLLVGTERGGVLCLKLSPNLRRSFNPGACTDVGDSRAVVRTDSQRAAARAAEAARLEAVLAAAGKCNAALRQEDMALL